MSVPRTARAVVVATVLCTAVVAAQESEMVVTRHQMILAGKPFRYTARAGFLPIRNNDTGEPHGKVFFVAYSADSAASARPLTFVWNGGPGSNSALVHLVGFGPRRIHISDEPVTPAPADPRIEDNQETWLGATDLVFVDPIGTGFSRPSRPEYTAEFYSTLGDIASIAEFVRVYRTRFDVHAAPVFLAGESYGTWRAAGVAEALEARGQRIAGVMLISGGIPFGPVASDAARTALFVPNRTAAAFYHRKLGADLQADLSSAMKQAEAWAIGTYAPAWARRDQLTPEETGAITRDLARFTGVDAAAIDRKTLAMTSPQFTSALLREQKLTLGRYDMRLTGTAPSPLRATLIARYLRGELQFTTDLAYQGVETGYSATGSAPSVGARWAWNQAPPGAPVASVGSGDGPPGGSQPWLRRAMALNPNLKAFVAAGLYDSLNSCADNAYIVARIEPEFSTNFTTGCYAGGHMMYDGAAARRDLQRDVATFIAKSIIANRQ
jgi:carboxypeptidase C (cathepsin A)